MKKIAILGAGISGLTVAWYLKNKFKNRFQITLFEQSHRVGGWIQTIVEDGFYFEMGPRCLSAKGKGAATLRLIEALGLNDKIIASNPKAHHRFVALDGKLHRFSLGFLIRHGAIGAAIRDLCRSKTNLEDESIAQFVQRRFNHQIATMVMDPLAKGICGGEIENLSIRSCMPLLWNFEQKYGSIIKGIVASRKKKEGVSSPLSLFSLEGGLETLPQTLAKQLDSSIVFNHPISSWNDIEADYIISALPTYALAKINGSSNPLDYATLSLTHFGWNCHVLKKSGFGFLLPTKENGEILGMTWDSEMFPQFNQGPQTRITTMIAGLHTEEELKRRTEAALKRYLGITERADLQLVSFAKEAIAQYRPFHFQTMANFKKTVPSNVYLIGSAFDGLGVNDLISHAELFLNDLPF